MNLLEIIVFFNQYVIMYFSINSWDIKMKLIKELGMLQNNPDTGKLLKHRKAFGIYECPRCLKHFASMIANVKRGKVTKCKSCSIAIKNFVHGDSVRGDKTLLHGRWTAMLNRCRNPKDTHYHRYGGRGISVCEAWHSFIEFKLWAESNGYSKSKSIDRIDPDKDYEPSNCRFVDVYTQAANVNKRPKNTSGYKGVISSRTGKWVAQITCKGVHTHLGTFDTAVEAATAYDNFVLENSLPHRLSNTNE